VNDPVIVWSPVSPPRLLRPRVAIDRHVLVDGLQIPEAVHVFVSRLEGHVEVPPSARRRSFIQARSAAFANRRIARWKMPVCWPGRRTGAGPSKWYLCRSVQPEVRAAQVVTPRPGVVRSAFTSQGGQQRVFRRCLNSLPRGRGSSTFPDRRPVISARNRISKITVRFRPDLLEKRPMARSKFVRDVAVLAR